MRCACKKWEQEENRCAEIFVNSHFIFCMLCIQRIYIIFLLWLPSIGEARFCCLHKLLLELSSANFFCAACLKTNKFFVFICKAAARKRREAVSCKDFRLLPALPRESLALLFMNDYEPAFAFLGESRNEFSRAFRM